jgi:hypothetical protein
MPIDVILTLLRDPFGNISLPVRVSLGGSSTGTSLASAIISSLRQALVGAASIPLKTVGALLRFGTGGMRIEAIPAEPGFPTLSPGAEDRISGLAGLIEERATLGVTLVGSAGDDDRDALAVRLLAQRLEAGDDLPEVTDVDDGFFARRRVERALRERARGETSPLEKNDEELLEEYVEATEVPAPRFDDLARQRAERVRDELITRERIAPNRIRVAEERSDDDPGVEIDFFVVE